MAYKPRARTLPGLEDRNIRALDVLAHTYANKRDERIQVGRDEKAFKTQVIAMMHKHKKTHYLYHGVEITLTPTAEKLKVTIRAQDEDGGPDLEPEEPDDRDTDGPEPEPDEPGLPPVTEH